MNDTPRGTDVDTLAGVSFPDPYRWLEGENDAVRAWQYTQNRQTSQRLAAWPHRDALHELVDRYVVGRHGWVRAAVDEVERHGTYVRAHVHPDAALRRAVDLGVHCIEHGTFISEETAARAAERGTSVVPTLAVVTALAAHGRELGLPQESLAKLAVVEHQALRSLEILKAEGVRTGFGTDLIGDLDRHQCLEFTIRRDVYAPAKILRSATSVNAEIIGVGDKLGRVAPDYLADLIVVDGDPLSDVTVFDEHGSRVPIVMKGGAIMKRR